MNRYRAIELANELAGRQLKPLLEVAEKKRIEDMEEARLDKLRIYVILRKDVCSRLSKAKVGVQIAHAALSAWAACSLRDPRRAWTYVDPERIGLGLLDVGQAKVVLEVADEAEARRLYAECVMAGREPVKVVDEARTELSEPTLTALALGPILRSEAPRSITKLRLYRDDPFGIPSPPGLPEEAT